MNKKKMVSPQALYPMETIESIDPQILKHCVEMIQNGAKLPVIEVVAYEGYYFIVEGIYEMLTANIVGKKYVEVEIISFEQHKNWLTEETLKEQLKIVGKNALYDFEALGGFKYAEYPVFY